MSDTQTTATPARDYEKVAKFPGLYRHTRSGRYYGAKKVNGKRRECSLRTCDRKIAERRLGDWVRTLTSVDYSLENTTLAQLIARFVAGRAGTSAKTQATDRCIIKQLERTWMGGLHVQVRRVRPSDLDAWLAFHEGRLKNTTYNRYAGFLKQLFASAVRDRIIIKSPFDDVRCAWKKPQEPIRLVPTEQQFEAILVAIRQQPHNHRGAAETADFVEFLGRAGVGQAEASQITWGDVSWQLVRITIRRKKTGALYYVPIYPDLKPLLKRLRKQNRGGTRAAPIFGIKDAKKALATACQQLGYPSFSQRSIRRRLIQKLWRAGVDKKLIAKWQGHRDGGELILNTYTEVFGADDDDYERGQLAKLAA
jgi:integrase